jgi:hypothetical protein
MDKVKGEALLEQYITDKKRDHPTGYTFGLHAARLAKENLDASSAIDVIGKLRNRYQQSGDIPLLEAVESGLLETFAKAKRWGDGIKLIEEVHLRGKTGVVINLAVYDFDHKLIQAGQTNEANYVLNIFFGGTNNTVDNVMPNGFWSQQAAETAMALHQPSNAIQMLNKIQPSSNDYIQTNQINIILTKIRALEELNKYPEAASLLSMAQQIARKGVPIDPFDRETLENKTRSYQISGWLDKDYKANAYQTNGPKPVNVTTYIIRAVIALLIIAPILVFSLQLFKKHAQK